jgi:hypothetical protein
LLTFAVSTRAVSGDKLIDAPPTENVDSTVVLTCPHPNLDPRVDPHAVALFLPHSQIVRIHREVYSHASDLWRGYSVPQGVVAESLDRGERLEAID